jgi:Na+-driven multidrug efflux pump
MVAGMRPFDPSLVFTVARYGIALAGVATIVVIAIWYLVPRRDPADRSR